MFTVAVPPVRPARLTPEEVEPFAFTLGAKIGEGAFSSPEFRVGRIPRNSSWFALSSG